MAQRQFPVFLLLATLGFLLRTSDAHKNHVVGGAFGWAIPPNATFYREWAATKTFVVGDRLVFLYRTSAQNVLEVSADDYEKCGNSNVTDMYYLGPTIIELNTTGPRFFYSGIGLHCEVGQKVAVNVTTTAPPPPYVADDSLYSLSHDEAASAPDASSSLSPPTVAASSANALGYLAPAAVLFAGCSLHAIVT